MYRKVSKIKKKQYFLYKVFLTISFGSIFQTESDGEHGVILEKLCSKGIPPEIVTVLKKEEP